ncbi:prepilin signal peptidase PulO-like enzyme (type II secretory pathway) [Brevibacillus aydinogluensis]|jgi:prepilin signal peptidase PulO-like enzyme (type II secretory pathway)|uniref:A24 family peptidase n=1 Tax=Brevibacillus aydinogluensis TaxID=927786 RepID=UPI0028937702|nr:A24 family peptidase [Brevibacillus aydinogluensis]MDT3417160.1 prepilin signal peptidase PulO-like enzyme (type II secretory pathway) [Brevibacillus aydinogluensis]
METVMLIYACLILLICSWTDWKRRIIPDVVTYPSIILALIYQLFWGNIWMAMLSGLLVFGVMWVLVIVLKGGIGGGDIKLSTFLAIALGYPLINPVLMVSFLLAIGYGKLFNQREVPLAPAILLGFIIIVPIYM